MGKKRFSIPGYRYPYPVCKNDLSTFTTGRAHYSQLTCFAVWILRFCETGSLSFSSCRRCHASLRVLAVLFNQSPGWTIHDYFMPTVSSFLVVIDLS